MSSQSSHRQRNIKNAEQLTYHNDDVFLRVIMQVFDNVWKTVVSNIVVRPVKMLLHVVNIIPLNILYMHNHNVSDPAVLILLQTSCKNSVDVNST